MFRKPHINDIRKQLENDPRATTWRSKERSKVAESIINRVADLKQVAESFQPSDDAQSIEHNAALRQIQQPLSQHEPHAGCYVQFRDDVQGHTSAGITLDSLSQVATLTSGVDQISPAVVNAAVGIEAKRYRDAYVHDKLVELSRIGRWIQEGNKKGSLKMIILPTKAGLVHLSKGDGKT